MPVVDDNRDERKKLYKNVAKHEDMRRRRAEGSVELRKAKKDEQVMKRRNITDKEDDSNDSDHNTVVDAATSPSLTPADIVAILSSSPSSQQMEEAFEAIRRLLSRNRDPPVDTVINCGLLPALVAGLSINNVRVQYEAAWALTNVVSGTAEQTWKAVDAGVIVPLVQLCHSPNNNVAEQAIWALANIVGDCALLRDRVIDADGVNALLHLTDNVEKLSSTFLRTLAWLYSNMCRHKNPQAPLSVLQQLASGIAILLHNNDQVVVQDSCWAVSYMSDGPDEQIEIVLQSGVLPRVVSLLSSDEMTVIAPAMRVLGNFVTGNDVLTQVVLDQGVLKTVIGPLMDTKPMSVLKECCWFISNVIAGTQTQIQAIIDAQLLERVVLALDKGDFKCQYEASWALANLAQGGSAQQVFSLFKLGAVAPLCKALNTKNIELVVNTLETLTSLLKTTQTHFAMQMEELMQQVEEANGLDMLEQLQQHENSKIYDLSYKIIDTYFNDVDDTDEENKENAQQDKMQEEATAPPGGFHF